ncbi:MAG: hypothetical protein D6715_09205 [Calditrichaeota bacterium]|nr:MAG: hypothetical protein D6715_09205 [Calditrichota bacterium]
MKQQLKNRFRSFLFRLFGLNPAALSSRYLFFGRREWLLVGAFFLLILIPSALLGYLSWRAIENEKLLARQRLEGSYRQVLVLASREVNRELSRIESKWRKSIRRFLERVALDANPELFDRFIAHEPLIESCFLLQGPGKLVYPTGVKLTARQWSPGVWGAQAHALEFQHFQQLKDQGEELEYQRGDFEGAIRIYRRLYRELKNPQLKASALAYLGRAQMKKGDLQAAYQTFETLLKTYPEVRDLNNLYLRFLAQLQMASILEIQGQDEAAIRRLVALADDLHQRSDAISMEQYNYFMRRVTTLATRLLTSQKIRDPQSYRRQLEQLSRQSKKRISQRFFIEFLMRKLYEATVEGKRYREKIHYVSGETGDDYYLLGYRFTPAANGQTVGGVFGFKVDTRELNRLLLSRLREKLKLGSELQIAVQTQKGDFLLGQLRPADQILASTSLEKPFDFWRVAVVGAASWLPETGGFRTVLGLWLVSLLVISIFAGAYLFIRRAVQEAYLAQLKTDFISRVSHELRTPLASMKMMAELLSLELQDQNTAGGAASAQAYAGVIQRECDRLNRLIENMMEWLRQEKGRRPYQFNFEDPALVFHNALEVFKPYAANYGFTVQASIPEELPELWMDADAIIQVIINLLHNAVKFSGDHREVSFAAGQEADFVWFSVTDRGVGIPRDQQKQIFEPYFQSNAQLNAPQQGGMGLGLTLVRQIVEDHNGRIEVNSKPHEGTTVRILLPIPGGEVQSAVSAGRAEKPVSQTVQSSDTPIGP